MSIYDNPELTPREYILMEREADEARLTREHVAHMKELELAIQKEKNTAAIELKKLEAKWSSMLRLPSLILRLPILVLLGFGYIIYALRGVEPSKDFWVSLK
jgi:hypothetical protein